MEKYIKLTVHLTENGFKASKVVFDGEEKKKTIHLTRKDEAGRIFKKQIQISNIDNPFNFMQPNDASITRSVWCKEKDEALLIETLIKLMRIILNQRKNKLEGLLTGAALDYEKVAKEVQL